MKMGNVIGKAYGKKQGENYAEGKVLALEGTFQKICFKGEIWEAIGTYENDVPCAEWTSDKMILKNVTKNITIEIEEPYTYETTENWIGDTIRLEPKDASCPIVILYINTYYT